LQILLPAQARKSKQETAIEGQANVSIRFGQACLGAGNQFDGLTTGGQAADGRREEY
jgi:hypothetical protein